jgi:chromosomal replication initiation ATPase DnaA
VSARGVIQSPVLVGRDAYLTLIKERLARAAAGTGQLLFVAGEAGIGKTRLLGSAARAASPSSGRRRFLVTPSHSLASCWIWPAA